jgi:UDP-N-acetylglucosamine 1-carboxyvinyltransferase
VVNRHNVIPVPDALAHEREPESPVEKLIIQGGRVLDGSVRVAGAKNAALPIMAAFLLAPGRSVLSQVPCLKDVETMQVLLESLGASCDHAEDELSVDATRLTDHVAHYRLVSRMRASFYVLGPLLARLGKARVSLPGGCAWGPRPVDLHLAGLKALGARIEVEHGYVVAAADRLIGAPFHFPISSVGATAHLLMAAATAKGRTTLTNAAREPEVVATAECLSAMGARIEGAGTTTITIDGVESLKPITFHNIPDRIEAGTYIIAGAMAGGSVRVTNLVPDHLTALFDLLDGAGVSMKIGSDWVQVDGVGRPPAINLMTEIFPGFPTDLQAQMMAFLARAKGVSNISETIYADRFSHVDELRRLGANITVRGATAVVTGVDHLDGAYVRSRDLRASASLVLAALVARGESHVTGVHHLDRGYEAMEDKLRSLGAVIAREIDQNGNGA